MTRNDECSDPAELHPKSSALEEILAGFQLISPQPSEDATVGGDAVSSGSADSGPLRPGSVRYLREGEIGRGGMGTILRVFDQHLRRRLAMKVTRARAPDAAVPVWSGVTPTLARFLEEAQITSQLEHPGIVPVHELGVDENHQIYFTMRLIRGSSLKEILPLVKEQRDGWSLTRALGVLLKVCETMSYAHDRGVIHRDLKPANVMVGRYGEVYVMDWGLARVVGRPDLHDLRPAPEDVSSIHTDLRELRESDEDSPLITLDGSVLGTPAYMSPEQAAGQVADVDRRSDVYTVGAMLYHLLTGQAPYLRPGARLSPHTILALVLNAQPAPILTLAPKVPAELVAICERAMAREALQRYADMSELAADLRAYLEGRVVRAYEAGALAELRKWVRRNKALATALAATVLVAVLGLSGVGYVEAKGRDAVEEKNVLLSSALGLAQENQSRAERESRTAEEVVAFLTGMFSAQDPNVARGRAVTVSEVLDTASHSMRSDLASEPQVRARLLGTLASVYSSLGQLEKARSLGGESLALHRSTSGPEDPDTWGAMALLGSVLADTGRLDDAEPLLMQAFERRRSAWGPEHAETLDSEDCLAELRRRQGRFDEALTLLTECLALRERRFGPRDAGTLQAKEHLVALRRDRGEFEPAALLAEEILAIREVDPGPDHPRTLATMNTLASVLEHQGRQDEARGLYERILATSSRILPPNHPEILLTEQRLAIAQYASGDRAEGERRLADVLARTRASLRDRHPAALEAAWHLADMARERGDAAAAIGLLEDQIGPLLDEPLQFDTRIARCLALLVELHLDEGHIEDARGFADELLRQTSPNDPLLPSWRALAQRARAAK